MQQHAAARVSDVPLTPVQRRTAIVRDTITSAERHLLAPAAAVLVDWRRARTLRAVHWFLVSLAFGLIAGVFLLTNGSSPLFRFWSGVFLLACEVLSLAGVNLAGPRALNSSHAEVLRGFLAMLIGFLFMLGATKTAAIQAHSFLVCLLGVVTAVSIALQAAAFEGAKQQYQCAAGAGSIRRETLLEISLRRHRAVVRGNKTEELIWRSYQIFRRMQQHLVPRETAGSADRFWSLNQKRMAVWVILGRRMNFVWLAVAAIVSGFQPVALFAVFCVITGAGNLLLLVLLALGWKSESRRA